MSEMERDTERVSSLEIVGSKGNGDEIEGKVTCNGEIVRTSEPLKNGSMSVGGESTKDSFDVAGSEPLDTRWRGDEEALTDLNYKDPPRNGHTPDSSSSEDDDETEGGAFAANWYVPLPQDPQESDEEEAEEEEEWSKGAAGLLQDPQDEESEHQPDQNASGSLKEVKPTSKMEDSQVEAIKQAMSGFSLPPRAKPQWAQVVPEDIWKAELIGGLQQTHRHKTKSKTKQKKF